MNIRTMIVFAAVSSALSVAMGAFAAHGLKEILEVRELAWIETAARYQLMHSLALLLVVVLEKVMNINLAWVGNGLILGIVFFSGSLYLLAFTGYPFLVFFTPLGGLCFIFAWMALAYIALRAKVLQ